MDFALFNEPPVLELICPHCGDINKMPLHEGFTYDKIESENMEKHMKGMRDYFMEMTGGKFDIISIYNLFILTDLRIKLEIDILTD